jgi:site-specific recombinase XerD
MRELGVLQAATMNGRSRISDTVSGGGFEVYRAWWSDVGSRLPPKTARTWRYFVLRAGADLSVDLIHVQARQVRGYLDEFRPQHANMIRCALNDFYRFCQGQGIRDDNPLEQVPRQRRPGARIKRALSHDELVRLLVALAYLPPKQPWSGRRVAQLALAQYLTGLRPGELLSLNIDRIRLNGSSSAIEVIGTKTDADRIVPLSAAARSVFADLTCGRRGLIAEFGTTRYYELVHRAAILIGLPREKARPYALRHTAATHMLERGATVRVVADVLGHRDLRHTMTYTIPGEDERRRAVDLLG